MSPCRVGGTYSSSDMGHALSEAGGSPARRYRVSLASGGTWAVGIFQASVDTVPVRARDNGRERAVRGCPWWNSGTDQSDNVVTAGSGLVNGWEVYP